MRRPYAWEGALIVFFFLLLLLTLNIVFGVIQAMVQEPLVLSPILILGELLILGLVVIWTAIRGLPWRSTFRLYKTSWSLLGLSFLVAVTWWFVATGLATVIEQIVSRIGPPPDIPPPTGLLDAVGYMVAVVFLAPLCEEPVFRGFIMQGWLRYGFFAGIVGSGILFGIQHGQLTPVIPISMVGIVLGILVSRAGSLWPGVVAHATYNAIGAPFLILPGSMPEISDTTLVIAGLAALPVALAVLWLYHRLAPPWQPPEREEAVEKGRLVATGVALVLVLVMFMVMVSLELIVRLNPPQVLGSL